jgi:AraC-like DNA-binding protein
MNRSSDRWLRSHLGNMQVDVSMAAYTKVPSDWRELRFVPDFNRLYFIMEGEGWLQIGDKEYYPQPGQLFVMPAGVIQSFSTINDNTFRKYWCHFTVTLGDVPLFKAFDLPHYIEVDDVPWLQSRFETLINHHRSDDLTSAIRVKASMFEILSFYLERVPAQTIRVKPTDSMDKVSVVLKYIDDHLPDNITVEQLAKLIYLHPNYFIHFFKSMLGSSPIQYINQRKLEKAKVQLMTTDLSISEIADGIGMQLHYFSRLFKNYAGYSPSTFRRMFRRQE